MNNNFINQIRQIMLDNQLDLTVEQLIAFVGSLVAIIVTIILITLKNTKHKNISSKIRTSYDNTR